MINVVDTNVIAVANGKFENIGEECLLNCINFFSQLNDKKFALDEGYEIFEEYLRYADMSGQPNIGDVFLKWLWNNHTNTDYCELVSLTRSENDEIIYNEIPFDEDLIGFDRSDQKFLAVALNSSVIGTIINATDSDWNQYFDAITNLGIAINNLCPDFFDC